MSRYAPFFGKLKRRELELAVAELHRLVDTSTSEEELQSFLAHHIYFLLWTPIYDHYLAVAKPEFGSQCIADFGLYGLCNGPWWTFVELERPCD